MNKKFLSAILFGALMVTSTGTFVSCKDYDDDIKGLQTQIDANKNAIAELQKLVGSGNWVTNVAASGSDLVVTMSNGSTVTVAGVKGADGQDGKDATEWTIGEDGFWYMDGEKTDKLAVAQNGKDGKDGVTAPSPKIENGLWVVYNWDAAKGEFVAETTDVPAAGTSSFVVLKNGVYTLNIADENGEMQEISLPATAESFTVNGITNDNLNVVFTYGEWKTPTTKADKEAFDKLAAKFPELKEYKDKDLVEQGGRLPFIVAPANVQLTKDHTFALVSLKGKDAGATLSNPTQGMPEGVDYYTFNDANGSSVTELQSRAAEESAVWSVDFVPALNKKGNGYEGAGDYAYSLVVSGPKGIVAATPYVYSYSVEQSEGLELHEETVKKYYNEDGFDIFVKTPDTDEVNYKLNPVVLKGMYILEVTDEADAEKYGISIDGSVVTVDNMPKGQSVTVNMTMTAIAVSGHVAVQKFDLTITDDIAATGALADMEVVLTGNYNKNGKFVDATQQIFWSLDELELSALQLKNFIGAKKALVIKDADKNDLNKDAEEGAEAYTVAKIYQADKKTEVTAVENYAKAAYIATTIDASNTKIIPGEYDVVLTAVSGETTILKAESNLTLVNPEEDLLPIKEAFLDEDGTVIAAALENKGTFKFDLSAVFDAKAGTTVASYKDMDNDYDAAAYDWWWAVTFADGLVINNTNASIEGGTATWTVETLNGIYDYRDEDFEIYEVDETPVDQVRTIKVTYNLFGNEKNQLEKEIQVKWASAIYAEDASDVITMTAAKLKIKFDDVTTTTTVNERVVDLKAITTAVYAAGSKKGQEYDLFSTAEGNTKRNYVVLDSYSLETSTNTYLMSTSNGLITLRTQDMLLLGYSPSDVAKSEAGTPYHMRKQDYTKIVSEMQSHLKAASLVTGYGAYTNYYYPVTATSTVNDTWYSMFVNYFSSIKYTQKVEVVTGNNNAVYRAGEIKFVQFRYVNETDAAYFAAGLPIATKVIKVNDEEMTVANKAYYDCEAGLSLTAQTSDKIDSSTLVEGKKVVPMQLIITDVWGKVMTYEFEVEISL